MRVGWTATGDTVRRANRMGLSGTQRHMPRARECNKPEVEVALENGELQDGKPDDSDPSQIMVEEVTSGAPIGEAARSFAARISERCRSWTADIWWAS
jgi:hypothetical protein